MKKSIFDYEETAQQILSVMCCLNNVVPFRYYCLATNAALLLNDVFCLLKPTLNAFADNLTCPCLWVGTSLGSVIVINLNLPGLNGDQRLQQPVIVSPSGEEDNLLFLTFFFNT